MAENPEDALPDGWERLLHDVEQKHKEARSGWAMALDSNDEKHSLGHERLRRELEGLKAKVENNWNHFDTITSLHRSEIGTLKTIASQPLDATKLVLSTPSIIGLVIGILAIVGSYWNLSAKLDSQQKMTDIQIIAIQQSVRETSARYELLRIEVQSLKETVIGKGRTP